MGRFSKFRALSWTERRVLATAVVLMPLVALGLRVLGLARLREWLPASSGPGLRKGPPVKPARMGFLVNAALTTACARLPTRSPASTGCCRGYREHAAHRRAHGAALMHACRTGRQAPQRRRNGVRYGLGASAADRSRQDNGQHAPGAAPGAAVDAYQGRSYPMARSMRPPPATGCVFLVPISSSGSALAVHCHPTPEVTNDTCEHLYLNQVVPLVLSRQNKLVFHASAVEIAGDAVAFLAESGRGKSTLAAAFATSGHRFLTDEGLVLEPDDGGYRVLPSHPSLRLWDDSRDALVAAGTATAAPVQYTPKTRFLAGREIAFCAEPRPLKRAYFLGDGSAAAVSFEPLRGREAMLAWVRNAFLLDPKERNLLAAHFEKLATLVNRVGCYRLDFPRRYDRVASVRHAIIEHLQKAT
jgi:hypothetical protein